MLFCCFVGHCVKDARKCLFAVHQSSAPCANNCQASKLVALDFCGKTLQDFRVQQTGSTIRLAQGVLKESMAFKGCSLASSC